MRFRRLWVYALFWSLCLLFTSAAARQTPVALGRSVVLTGNAARPLFRQCSRSSPEKVTGYWTPTAADLKQFEPKLRAYLKTVKLPGKTTADPGSYYCQCVGFTRGGGKFIYVNAFHPHVLDDMARGPGKPFDWRRNSVDACDGGSSFFGVEYDTSAGKFLHFAVNGR